MPIENKPAEPLKVERSTVTKLVITGAKGPGPNHGIPRVPGPEKRKDHGQLLGKEPACLLGRDVGRALPRPVLLPTG